MLAGEQGLEPQLPDPESEERLFASVRRRFLPHHLPDNDSSPTLVERDRAEATRDLLVRMLRRAPRAAPLVIVIEDAHWLDSVSWAVVQRAAESIESLLLVLATRPLSEPPPELQDVLAQWAHRYSWWVQSLYQSVSWRRIGVQVYNTGRLSCLDRQYVICGKELDMLGPFPGMDSYLEEPSEWPDVHIRLITAISDALAAAVAPAFIVRIEQRVYITTAEETGRQPIVLDRYLVHGTQTEPAPTPASGISTPTLAGKRWPRYVTIRPRSEHP